MDANTNATRLSNQSAFDTLITQPDWIIPFAINLLLMIVTLIVIVSLIHYGVKTGKWRETHSGCVDKLNAGIVYTFLLVCGVFCVFRFIANQIYMNVGFNENENSICEAAADAAFTSYSLMLWSVSMFLWFRQRAFYTNRMLSFESTKIIRIVSFSSNILLNAAGFTYILLFTIPNNYQSSPVGCIFTPDESFRDVYAIYAVLLIIIAHALLFGLFIYPLLQMYSQNSAHSYFKKLIKSKQDVLKANKEPLNSQLTSPNQSSAVPENLSSIKRRTSLAVRKPTKGIKRILQKSLVFAAFSILLDVVIQIISTFANSPSGSRRFNNMLFDITAFVNMLFLIFSFVTFKSMLFSLCLKDAHEEKDVEYHASTYTNMRTLNTL